MHRLNLDLAQCRHDLCHACLLTSPHVRLPWSWLILSIGSIQSHPVSPGQASCRGTVLACKHKIIFIRRHLLPGCKQFESRRCEARSGIDLGRAKRTLRVRDRDCDLATEGPVPLILALLILRRRPFIQCRHVPRTATPLFVLASPLAQWGSFLRCICRYRFGLLSA